MSESNRPAEQQPDEPNLPADAVDATDEVEGSYTEADGEAPHERTVAGEYTRTDGVADDESAVGEYTSTEEHPQTHDPAAPEGDYVSEERPKPHPHPGLHHI